MRPFFRRFLCAAVLLALSNPAVRAGDDAKPDEKGAVRDALVSLMKGPEKGQEDAAPWLHWRRYGIAGSPTELVGDLDEFVVAMRGTAAGVFPEVGRLNGTAPHRHALAKVDVLRKAYAVFLVEEDGWKVVRADRLEEKTPVSAAPAPAAPPVLAAGVAARVDEAVEDVLKAIDGRDAKAFAARSIDLSGAAPKRLEAKDVEEQLAGFHGKYGARAHRVGAALPEEAHGRTHYAVPVVFGEEEDLLFFVFADVEGRMLLSNVSEGRPSDFVAKPVK